MNNENDLYVKLCLRHKKTMREKNVLVSVYTNASGYLWAMMMVDSGTDLGWSGFRGDFEDSHTFKTYEGALKDALDLIDLADLREYKKFNYCWSGFAEWLMEKQINRSLKMAELAAKAKPWSP